MSTYSHQQKVASANAFRVYVWPELERGHFPGWRLQQVELSKDEVWQDLDKASGFDVILIAPNGNLTVSLSVRIRYGKSWDSFTLRDTELKKRWEAFQMHANLPTYHVQARIWEGKVASIGMVLMGKLVESAMTSGGLPTPGWPWTAERNRGPGDHAFAAANFADLERAMKLDARSVKGLTFDVWDPSKGWYKVAPPPPVKKTEPEASIFDLFTDMSMGSS
jgi:hypothetical protein